MRIMPIIKKMDIKRLLKVIFFIAFFVLANSIAKERHVYPRKVDGENHLYQTADVPDNKSKKDARPTTPPTKDREENKNEKENGFDSKFWITIIIGLAGFAFGLYQYLRRKREKKIKIISELEAEKKFREHDQFKKARTAEEIYCAALKEELGTIYLAGSPDIECRAVKLEDAFVSLAISEYWRSEQRFTGPNIIPNHQFERYMSPEQVMKRAFQNNHLLLVIGDPGSGKTTLLKYYAVNCLDKTRRKYKNLGLSSEVLPIYFPLRDLEFACESGGNDRPVPLPENLGKWSARHLLNITAEQFHTWLSERDTLVLLDGLDEISSKEQRKKACQWIKQMCTGFGKARFVVTSRATGYRKLDGIELEVPHLRADIMDFSPQQQADFLEKWFRAVYFAELPLVDLEIPEPEWREQQKRRADQRSQTIIEFLKKDENKTLRELASVPMLLQIMAIIWKDRQYLPTNRPSLFDSALNYLLDYRDRQKNLEPLLPARESIRVLAPTALWMQEKLKKDEAPKDSMHNFMQPILDTLESQPQAVVFCDFLRDRTGLIADYDRNHYIFRHKSFREFLSGIQLLKTSGNESRMEFLIKYFREDWWEESLRFFMSISDDEIFDRFMRIFFQSPVSKQLDAHQQTLLQLLVKEAPQRKINALKDHLYSDSLNNHQRRYVLDCLKTIGTPDAIKAIENADKSKLDKSNLAYAEDIVTEALAIPAQVMQKTVTKEQFLHDNFRSIFEGNVEYIKIPGGTYQYSVSKKMVTVPDLFFCKYPVTNKRYRRFISFLDGKEKELEKELSLDMFAERLLKFAETIKEYSEYLEKDPKKWQKQLSSYYENDKKFNGDDQPVVGVTWYAARAYCFWLSCLDAAVTGDNQSLNEDISRLAYLYRLPTEEEWEWAAGGEPDGSTREYPWPKDKGKPNQNLANYGEHVGATTPVDRYPEGATPSGLMDMAGNVWEWMENYYDEDKGWPALRGGCYYSDEGFLFCSARGNYPHISWLFEVGFRVLRASPPVI